MKLVMKSLIKTILATCGDIWPVDHCIRESTRLRTNCDPLLAYPRPPSTLRIHLTLSFPQPVSVEVQWPHIVCSHSASFIVQVYSFWTVRLYSLANVYQALRCQTQNTVPFIVPPWRSEISLLVYLIVYGWFKETLNKSVYSAILEDSWMKWIWKEEVVA
jgi:hypothetical protein